MNFPANFCASRSSSNVTHQYWSLEGDHITHGLVIAVYLVFCELLSLPWNILVFVTIIKEKLWHQPNIILLVNLIVADIFILLFPTPLVITVGFAGEFILGSSDETRCKYCVVDFFVIVPLMNSILTVTMISLDRFFYIYTPLKYELPSTKYIAGVAVVTSIIASIAFGFMIRYIPGTNQFFKPLMSCIVIYGHPSLLVPLLVVTIFSFLLVVTAVSNGCFSWIVLRNIRIVYSNASSDGIDKQKQLCKLNKRVTSTGHKKQKRLCCMQLALLLASLFTLVPVMVLFCISQLPASDSPLIGVVTVIFIMHYSQVYIHPILETSLISDIRIPLRDMLTCGYFKEKPKDGFISDRRKFCGCIQEGEKCSFFITALQAAIIPRDNSSIDNNEQLS